MKANIFAEWKAGAAAELRKLFALKTPTLVLAITLSLMAVILLGEAVISHSAPAQMKPTVPDLNVIWRIFHTVAQYMNPLILALIMSAQVGKEFEWKTFHQIQLKGQLSSVYVLSKLSAFFAIGLGVFFTQAVLVFIYYTIRALIAEVPFDIPMAELLIDPLQTLLAISVGFVMAVAFVSSSVGIIFTLLYLVILEWILFPLFASLLGMLEKHTLATALSYTPMKLTKHLAESQDAGEAAVLVITIFGVLGLLGYLSYLLLERRQIGLIR